MIEEYDFGRIVIDEKLYFKDLRIIDGEILPDWVRKEGHFLDVDDLKEVFPVGTKKSGKGRRKVGRKKRRMRSKIRHRKK